MGWALHTKTEVFIRQIQTHRWRPREDRQRLEGGGHQPRTPRAPRSQKRQEGPSSRASRERWT